MGRCLERRVVTCIQKNGTHLRGAGGEEAAPSGVRSERIAPAADGQYRHLDVVRAANQIVQPVGSQMTPGAGAAVAPDQQRQALVAQQPRPRDEWPAGGGDASPAFQEAQ